ncbi:MAG TPA: hypothetical protein VLQ45_12840 [Thermoanaerobaculia bacterium]|nr:hypothetical protein [Thermoanaerobaculia bacterium]
MLRIDQRVWVVAITLASCFSVSCMSSRPSPMTLESYELVQSDCFAAIEPVPSEELDAPETVRRAYSLLRSAEVFSSPYIGFGGEPSCEVMAFQRILDSPVADGMFKRLIEQATLAGQLYGLSGLYFTDPGSFVAQVDRYGKMKKPVRTQNGCIISEEPVMAIVEAPRSRYGIANGRLPRSFKSAFRATSDRAGRL